MITQKQAKEMFTYKDGLLFWRKKPSCRIHIGSQVGSIADTGYMRTCYNKRRYYNHRLIFLMFRGFFPQSVDHIDGNKLNNKIENLRECTNAQNQYNRKLNKNNTSGVKGVFWDKKRDMWNAQIVRNGKKIYLGLFKSIERAAAAMKAARSEYHGEFVNHG